MAIMVLAVWPLLATVMFVRMHIRDALIWAVVVPYLFLPEAISIDLPGLPDIDKGASISLGLFLGVLLNKITNRSRGSGSELGKSNRISIIVASLSVLAVGAVVASVVNNSDPIVFGDRYLPGLDYWDAVSSAGTFFLFGAPFYFAYCYLALPVDHRALLAAIVIMGAVYSLLMLVEIRLSPQLHRWVYGYHQHSFLQHIRDGYRPMVFLQHGLWVGFYIFTSLMSALALWKCDGGRKWLSAFLWLFVILSASENLAAFSIAIFMVAVVLLFRLKWQLVIAAAIAGLVLIYPAPRQAGLVPTGEILDLAAAISEDRAQSLRFRLDNEDVLLEKALQKPLTGWGTFGRDQVYDDSGRRLTVSEGRWLQTLGMHGWLGYFALFGLLTFPIFGLFVRSRTFEIGPETVMLSLICAGNLIYMIPNSTLTPVGLLMFGAMAGYLRIAKNAVTKSLPESSVIPHRSSRYSRFS